MYCLSVLTSTNRSSSGDRDGTVTFNRETIYRSISSGAERDDSGQAYSVAHNLIHAA